MPTPTIPSTGPVSMDSIRNAFPGLSNPPNLAEFIGAHPSLPTTAGSSISLGQFHGLTAVSPSFNFSNVALSNGNMTASNGTLVISGSAGVSKALAGSIPLSNYLSLGDFNAPVSFAMSNGSSLPTGVSMGSNGLMTLSLTNAVASTTNVVATNKWGNCVNIPMSYNIIMLASAMPTATNSSFNWSVMQGYGNNQVFYINWSFTCSDTTYMTIAIDSSTYFNGVSSYGYTSTPQMNGRGKNDFAIQGWGVAYCTPTVTFTFTNSQPGCTPTVLTKTISSLHPVTPYAPISFTY